MTRNDFKHLLSSLKALSPQQCGGSASSSTPSSLRAFRRPARPPNAPGPPRREEAADRRGIRQRLLAEGRLASLPDPSLDLDDDDPEDQPIAIEGEPLSETILRERR